MEHSQFISNFWRCRVHQGTPAPASARTSFALHVATNLETLRHTIFENQKRKRPFVVIFFYHCPAGGPVWTSTTPTARRRRRRGCTESGAPGEYTSSAPPSRSAWVRRRERGEMRGRSGSMASVMFLCSTAHVLFVVAATPVFFEWCTCNTYFGQIGSRMNPCHHPPLSFRALHSPSVFLPFRHQQARRQVRDPPLHAQDADALLPGVRPGGPRRARLQVHRLLRLP